MPLPHANRCSDQLTHTIALLDQARLVADRIDSSAELGPGGARTRREGVPVWALIGYLEAHEGDVDQVAADYELPRDTVRAAVLYYHQQRAVIAARIEEQRLLRSGDEPATAG